MEVWTKILALSAGGVVGVNARYWLGVWANRLITSDFPWATFAINTTGSFAIGFLAVIFAQWSPHSHLQLMTITGLLGGYTTFSTFAYDSVTLWQRGEWRLSMANAVGSVVAGCAAVLLGAALALTVAKIAPEVASKAPTKPFSIPAQFAGSQSDAIEGVGDTASMLADVDRTSEPHSHNQSTLPNSP